MEVLRIREIREEDGPIIGADLYRLAKLQQANLPVPDGIIVCPPEIHLKTALEHFKLTDKEVFEQRLTIIKQEVEKIPIPDELSAEFTKRKLDAKKLWLHLLDFWLQQIRSRIWREGFSPNLTRNLSAQPIFFMDKIHSYGKAYFDFDLGNLMLDVEHGEITKEQTKELEKYVQLANKKLYLPQVYDWSIEKKLFLVKVTPFTSYEEKKETEQAIKAESVEKKVNKSSVKIFLNMQNNFRIENDLDGAIVSSEKQPDFDSKLLQLIESAQTLNSGTVIFKLFDKKDRFGRIRGAQYLIHDKSILKKDIEALNFLRNQKNCKNISIALPFVRSAKELKDLKQELLALKVSRTATLKFWLEMAVPENLLNAEKYMEAGIDGIILNCDSIVSWLGGYDPEEPDSVYYQGEIDAFLELVKHTLPKLHKEKLPVIATGNLALHDDVLELLVSKGIWGLGLDSANVGSIHERIKLIERRLLNKK
jgi:phosphoenolpyruvate synthase/pyruvate phosphate dikinase